MALRTYRKTTGSAMIDLPISIWALIMLITIPLLDFATVALRATFVASAAKDAVHAAARSTSFSTNIGGQLSATNLALTQAQNSVGAFNGLTFRSAVTSIVATNTTTQASTKQSTKLSAPADIGAFTYNLETRVTADVSPLITYNARWFGNVPGLTTPYRLTAAAQEFCEYPQGLDQ
jgi:hypothetical protein